MRLTPPKKNVFIISLILAIIAVVVKLLAYFIIIPVLPVLVFWILAASWLLLVLGIALKGF